jgi:hypothetical protein
VSGFGTQKTKVKKGNKNNRIEYKMAKEELDNIIYHQLTKRNFEDSSEDSFKSDHTSDEEEKEAIDIKRNRRLSKSEFMENRNGTVEDVRII